MLRDFIGANKVLFKIPVYQRNYDWAADNCLRLLEDIKSIIETKEKHFLGTIVFMSAKTGGFSMQEYIIIDGQQRLTTMMIMLKALSAIAKVSEDPCFQEIEELYLHNRWCEEKDKVKLKPIKTDNEQFELLLQENFFDMDKDSHIYKNYCTCKEVFDKWQENGIGPEQVLNALTKIEIVEIVLTKGEDDPQIIFESINSTGLDLSNADLIRNFLLMNAEQQEMLFENYWVPIEKALKRNGEYTVLDAFFTQYLALKTRTPTNSKKLYEKFVKTFKENNYTQEKALKELKYFADIYKTFVYGNAVYPLKVNEILQKIRQLNQTTCYPFLMQVFDDYNQNIIDENTLEKTLQFVLAYLLRRIVCGVPSNTLRALFIYLHNRIFKIEKNKEKYYEAINKFFFNISSKDAMPTVREFENNLMTANIYGNAALAKFLLLEIENDQRKEKLQQESLTIEHVMPQTLNEEWPNVQEEEHKEWLHTIGNLTVTGYNSELSNKSFEEKKAIITGHSKANELNRDILNQHIWGAEQIKARGQRLAADIIKKYNLEKVEDESIVFENVDVITLEDFSKVTGRKLVSYIYKGRMFLQARFAGMVMDVIRLLDQDHPGKLEILAREKFKPANSTHVYISNENAGFWWGWQVKDGVYAEAQLSAHTCVRFIEGVIAAFNEKPDIFSFQVMADEEEDAEDELLQVN